MFINVEAGVREGRVHRSLSVMFVIYLYDTCAKKRLAIRSGSWPVRAASRETPRCPVTCAWRRRGVAPARAFRRLGGPRLCGAGGQEEGACPTAAAKCRARRALVLLLLMLAVLAKGVASVRPWRATPHEHAHEHHPLGHLLLVAGQKLVGGAGLPVTAQDEGRTELQKLHLDYIFPDCPMRVVKLDSLAARCPYFTPARPQCRCALARHAAPVLSAVCKVLHEVHT